MPRHDYERLLGILRQCSDGYGVWDRRTSSEWHFAMYRFVDLETIVETNYTSKSVRSNVWIDIFPLDGMPKNQLIGKLHMSFILAVRYLIQLKYIDTQMDASRKRPFYERMVIFLARVIPIAKLINGDTLLDFLEHLICRYDYDNSEYVADFLGKYRMKEIVPKDWYGKTRFARFEDIDICIPSNSEAILSQIYGDFMTPPKEEERYGHKIKIIKMRRGI